MYKTVPLLYLVGVFCTQENGDLDSIIDFIFGKPPMPPHGNLNSVQKSVTIIPPVSQSQDTEDQPCTTHDGKEGRCMSHFLCDTNNTVNDGDGITDMSVQSDKCNFYQDVCCNIPDVTKPNNPITPRPDKEIGMAQENGDMDSLIEFIFGKPPMPSRATLNNVQKPGTIVPTVSQPQDTEDQPCTTHDGKEGRCIRHFLCDTNNTVNDGDGISDMSVQSAKCNPYLLVCCNIPNVRNRDNAITPLPDKQIGMAQENRDLDSIIDSLFGKTSTPTRAILNNVQKPGTIVPPVSKPQDTEDQPCTTHDGKERRCMRHFLCDTNNTVNDADGNTDMSAQTDKCNSYQDVCCNIPDVTKPENPITPRPDKQIGMGQENGDLDAIIQFIFGKPPMPSRA